MALRLINYHFHAMGSPCSAQFYASNKKQEKEAKQGIKNSVEVLESRYSRYRESSLISRINAAAGLGKPIPIDSETAALLTYAEQCYQESAGLFDVTSGILRRLWSPSKTRLPSQQAIDALLPLIAWHKVQWSNKQIYLPEVGMQLDFGGIVKEYAADTVAHLLYQQGIRSGIVELGGDVKIIGAQPNGEGWPIGIRDPRQPDKTAFTLSLKSGALASSGDYERFQLIDGVRYSHLMNPKTGLPVTGLSGVSVLSEHCVIAGSVATIAMLKGKHGRAWLDENEVTYFCCSSDGKVQQTM